MLNENFLTYKYFSKVVKKEKENMNSTSDCSRCQTLWVTPTIIFKSESLK